MAVRDAANRHHTINYFQARQADRVMLLNTKLVSFGSFYFFIAGMQYINFQAEITNEIFISYVQNEAFEYYFIKQFCTLQFYGIKLEELLLTYLWYSEPAIFTKLYSIITAGNMLWLPELMWVFIK